MNNEQLELLIKEKGLTAPRVTLKQLNDKIVSVEYLEHQTKSGSILRWAIIELENGFTATGCPSISVSPENDNKEIGEQVAFDNAFQELWPLEGYLLKQKLFVEQS